MTGKKGYPTALLGFRIEGELGWKIEEFPFPYDQAVKELERRNVGLHEIKLISEGTVYVRDDEGKPYVGFSSNSKALSFGWAYDPTSKCWRSPGEMMSEPPGAPSSGEDLEIFTDGPESGWWRITLRTNMQEHTIHCSNEYDPLEELIHWLEMVSKGKSSIVLVDEEGSYTAVTAYARDEGKMRLVCHHYLGGIPRPFDILVSRKKLVQDIYAAFKVMVTDSVVFDEEWGYLYTERGEEYSIPSSDLLEKYVRESS